MTSFGTPRLVRGPVGRAYEFDGSEYVSLGRQDDNCLGGWVCGLVGGFVDEWVGLWNERVCRGDFESVGGWLVSRVKNRGYYGFGFCGWRGGIFGYRKSGEV